MITFRPSLPVVRLVASTAIAGFVTMHWSILASAQESPRAAAVAATPVQAAQPRSQYDRIVVTAGQSTVVATDFEITRIAITNPEIADAVVVQPQELLVDCKKAGTVSLIVWSSTGRKQYDIVVEPSITAL